MKQLNDLNWNHLYYFFEVARLHSIKKVSELTDLSPSTISEQIKKLEQQLDTKLFNRSKTGLLLTPKGEMLYEHARVIFGEGYRVLEKFSSDEVGGYPVLVGVDSAIFPQISSEYIGAYWDLYARFGVVNTRFQGDHDILIQNTNQGHIDWGLSLTPSKRKTLTSIEVGKIKLQLCCAKAIYDRFKKKSDICLYLPFMETTYNHPIRKKLLDHLRSHGVIFNETCHTDSTDYLLHLVRNGRAVGLLPEKIIKNHPDIKTINSKWEIEHPLYAIWKNSNEALLSISTLKSLIQAKNKVPKPNIYYQLKVSEVPKEKLKN